MSERMEQIREEQRQREPANVRARMSADEFKLRQLLWLRHHATTVGLYGDDGEMQCNICMIDFLRNTVDEIEERFHLLTQRELAKPDVKEAIAKMLAESSR